MLTLWGTSLNLAKGEGHMKVVALLNEAASKEGVLPGCRSDDCNAWVGCDRRDLERVWRGYT